MDSQSYKNWAEAFTIFAKYETEEGALVSADHEILYAGTDAESMSKEDVERLEELGWNYDEHYDSFYIYT